MLAHDTRGADARPLEPPDPNQLLAAEINALLAELGPLLLAVSVAADGPTPAAALDPIRLIARHTLTLVLQHI